MNTEKYILERINDILKRPSMHGSCNETIEFQILTLLEVWILDTNGVVKDLYITESKKLIPDLGSFYPSKNKYWNHFNSFLNKVIPIIIEKLRELK